MTVDNLVPSTALPAAVERSYTSSRRRCQSAAALKASSSASTPILIIVALVAPPFVLGLASAHHPLDRREPGRLLAVADRIAEGDLYADKADATRRDEIDRRDATLRDESSDTSADRRRSDFVSP